MPISSDPLFISNFSNRFFSIFPVFIGRLFFVAIKVFVSGGRVLGLAYKDIKVSAGGFLSGRKSGLEISPRRIMRP